MLLYFVYNTYYISPLYTAKHYGPTYNRHFHWYNTFIWLL